MKLKNLELIEIDLENLKSFDNQMMIKIGLKVMEEHIKGLKEELEDCYKKSDIGIFEIIELE